MLFSHVVSCSAAPGRVTYPCIAQRCADGTTTDLTQDVVRNVPLSLVPDDSEIDGHRECRILLSPQSTCKFNITRGSTQLRVTDNEGEFGVTLSQSSPAVTHYLILSTKPVHHWSFENQLQFSFIHHSFIRKNL